MCIRDSDSTVTPFCASRALWDYTGPTYNKEHLQFAREEEAAERNRVLLALRDETKEAVMNGNIEAADRWTVEYEAQQRAARGPWILEEVPDVAGRIMEQYTPEEIAQMQAMNQAAQADSERKRQAAWGLLPPIKRSRNS